MSTSIKVQRIALLLLSQSLDVDNRIEEKKVLDILNQLRESPPLQYIEILKRFAFLVKRHMSSYQGILEFNGGNGEEIATRLCQKEFIKSNKTEIHPTKESSLIAGLRLKIGDDVYEDSIVNRLNNIKKVLL